MIYVFPKNNNYLNYIHIKYNANPKTTNFLIKDYDK